MSLADVKPLFQRGRRFTLSNGLKEEGADRLHIDTLQSFFDLLLPRRCTVPFCFDSRPHGCLRIGGERKSVDLIVEGAPGSLDIDVAMDD